MALVRSIQTGTVILVHIGEGQAKNEYIRSLWCSCHSLNEEADTPSP